MKPEPMFLISGKGVFSEMIAFRNDRRDNGFLFLKEKWHL